MARSITFNGITRFRPGAISRVNAEALNQIGISSGGVLGLIGEADGGAPGTAGLVSMRDPSRATDLFRSGPLVDAIKLAFQSSGDPLIPGGAAEVVVYKTNASTQSSVNLPSTSSNVVTTTVSGGASTTTAVDVAAVLVASAHIGRWAKISIAALPGAPSFLRRITANTTGQITVTPALPQAPAAADVVVIHANLIALTSRDYGAHTATIDANLDYNPTDASYAMTINFEGEQQISPTLGGVLRNYLHVVYRGGPLNDSTLVTASSTVTLINVTAASLVNLANANMTFVLKDSSGNLKAISKITTNTVSTITLATALSAVPVVGDIVEIYGVTAATGTITGASGLATAFTTSLTGVTGDNLNIAITPTMTVNQLKNAINANNNYLATVPSQINGDVELASQFDWGTSTATSIQTSYSGTVATTGFRQDLKEIVAWINANAVYLTAARSTTDVLDGGDGNVVDYPDDTGDPLPWSFLLSGGTRGISANSNFQAGFDAMLLRVVNDVVPMIDQDLTNEGNSSTATWTSVAAQLVDHVSAARGAAGLERGGWIGFRGTKAAYITACNSINDADIACVSQSPTVVSSTGDLVLKGPREFAVMGASMRLGAPEIGEPLTNKFLRVSAITQDSSWNPTDVTDSGDLIQNGAMFAETVVGLGTRWVRDLTTWVKDDNLAYTEGSIRSVVRFVVYGLRTLVQNRFTGRKATPATIASIKDAVASLLETYRTGNIIVDSTDPATGTVIRAYHGLKVYSTGDVVQINVGIFPVPGINFELIDLFLSLASQSA